MLLSASVRKGLLDPDLQSVQNPDHSIFSIMQKRAPGPGLTICSKPKPFYCQDHAEKASSTMTYILFKTQTILLSASCRKGLLDPDLHPVQNPDHSLSASCRKGLLDPDLQTVQNPDHSIVSIMQRWPPGSWLTCCSKPRPFHCQHHAEKASWTLTYKLFKPRPFYCQHHVEKASWTWLTPYSKPRPFYCQPHEEKASWTLTHILFKSQTILLSAPCRKGLLDPDSHPVQSPDHSIVSII